jgi:hypothetical protein
MKKATVFCLFFVSFIANSTDLPKGLVGQYAGEMEAFDFIHNELELSAASHEIKMLFTESGVLYSTGTMQYRGEYQFVAEDDNKYIIKTKMTNDLSMTFVLKIVYDKKTKTLILDGSNGIPDTSLSKKIA